MITKTNFKVDFIIPHINNIGLKKTLLTIRKNTDPENINKIILIDQNPDGYQEVDEYVDVHIRMDSVGFAKAVNTGLRISDSKWAAVWNDDCECIHPKWVNGIIETFNRYSTALGCNLSSPRNPSYSGGPPVDHPDFPYKEKWTEADYDKLVNEIFNGHIIDGICTFATIFDKDKLNKTLGVIPDKCWFDEGFVKSGGEDYDLSIRAYTSGFRMLGTELSGCYHFWYSSKREDTGKAGVKYDSSYHDKWRFDLNGQKVEPDIYGKLKDLNGNCLKDESGNNIKLKPEQVPQNIIRN